MKTVFLSASLSRKAGGIFEIELALARQLVGMEVDVTAFGLEDDEWQRDESRWQGVNTTVFKTAGPGVFGYAPGMLKAMMDTTADVAHLHYMWMYPSVAVTKWAARTGKPYVVTPNGMLEPWALSNSAWKKKLAGFLYENRMLHGAACLQANTEKELQDFRAYGLKNPIALIPNGVDLVNAETLKTEKLKSEKKILLFLGRLHPKKGLVNALRAWSEIRGQGAGDRGQEEWQFVIAGWDQGGHEAELKCLCDELGLAWADVPAAEFVDESSPLITDHCSLGTSSSPTPDSCPLTPVIFTGPAFGNAKDQLLRQASAFILPSFSEGLPMSVLEAWSYRLPVLMTDHCNLPEGFSNNAAIRIGTGIRGQPMGIDEGMRALFEMTEAERVAMGQRGRALVESQFTWPQVAAQMKEVYEWVLGAGTKPDCVRL